MAVTVGTDVYLSVADADTYHSNLGNTTWTAATTAAKEAALREATQYIDGAYSFIGEQITSNVLAWPRSNVYILKGNFAGITYDSSTIPPQVENACAELALEALSNSLSPNEARGGAIKKEKVDVVEVEYMDWAPSGKTYKYATMILKPVLQSTSRMKGLIRS